MTASVLYTKPTESMIFNAKLWTCQQTTRPTRSRDEVKLKQMKIPFSLDEIINNPIEWFTDVTTNPKFRFSPQQVDLLRSIRKRGKNKEAAQNCRKRKLDEIQSLEMEVDALSARRIELAKSCGSLENNIDKLARKFTELQERILVSARRSNQKFGDGDMSLHFDRTGVIRLVEGSQCRQRQLDEWDSMTKTDNSNRKTAKTKRKQTKRNWFCFDLFGIWPASRLYISHNLYEPLQCYFVIFLCMVNIFVSIASEDLLQI